jgi:hypothetical protein
MYYFIPAIEKNVNTIKAYLSDAIEMSPVSVQRVSLEKYCIAAVRSDSHHNLVFGPGQCLVGLENLKQAAPNRTT